MSSENVKKSRRVKYAIIIVIILAALGFSPFCYRYVGILSIANIQAKHKAEGLGGSLYDIIADMPMANADRQARWWQWQEKVDDQRNDLYDFVILWEDPDVRKWRLGLSSEPPSNVIEALASSEELIQELYDILEGGPLIFGPAGYLKRTAELDNKKWLAKFAQDINQGSYNWDVKDSAYKTHLSSYRFAVYAIGLRALTSKNPTKECGVLDKFIKGYSHVSSLEDAMIYLSAKSIRDETICNLVMRNSAPKDVLATWINETDYKNNLLAVAEGMRGERLLHYGAFAELAKSGEPFDLRLYFYSQSELIKKTEPLRAWLNGPYYLYNSIEALAETEQRMRLGPNYSFDPDLWQVRTKQFSLNFIEGGVTAYHVAYRSRCWRVIALILRDYKATGILPAYTNDLIQLLDSHKDLLFGGDEGFSIAYDKLSPTRFRLRVNIHISNEGVFTPLNRYDTQKTKYGPPRQFRRPKVTIQLKDIKFRRGVEVPVHDDVPPSSWGSVIEVWVP